MLTEEKYGFQPSYPIIYHIGKKIKGFSGILILFSQLSFRVRVFQLREGVGNGHIQVQKRDILRFEL